MPSVVRGTVRVSMVRLLMMVLQVCLFKSDWNIWNKNAYPVSPIPTVMVALEIEVVDVP